MANLQQGPGQFWLDIHEKLADTLSAIQKDGLGIIQRSEQSIVAAREALGELRRNLEDYVFADQKEEIYFYKTVEPDFYSTLLFHTCVYKTELGMPPGIKSDQEAYLKHEIERVGKFFQENGFIYQYLRSGQTFLDEKLFVRPNTNAIHVISVSPSPEDPVYSASFAYLVGRIRANEELLAYFTKAIEDLNKTETPRATNRRILVWTESKTAAIEWAYALHATGAINNGKVEIKEIIDAFQEIFHVNLGNYPRTFQEILSRKTGYTTFIQKCMDKLLLRIQTIEDKYIK